MILCLIIIASVVGALDAKQFKGNPVAAAHPCDGNDNIFMQYISGRPPEDENQYIMFITDTFEEYSRVKITFDGSAILNLTSDGARISSDRTGAFNINFYKSGKTISMNIKGTTQGVIPYPTSINIDGEEACEKPKTKIFDNYMLGNKTIAVTYLEAPSGPACGRRQVSHTELITNSLPTKPGDWPWHAAVYRFEKGSLKYKCGGTLISKTTVLTAAHCSTLKGVAIAAEILNVVLGKYNLIGGDITPPQEREVHKVIVHEKYKANNLNNDISILKLKSEVIYGEYVQPACIWTQSLDGQISGEMFGTVVGWGFDQNDQTSLQLRQATMPKVSESTCIKSNPVFFGRLMNDYKFCAGFKNGTSACNGDSGGGFTVFVPDSSTSSSGSESNISGSWYIRGIVSVGVAKKNVNVCDPYEYVLFTDVAKYNDWIDRHIVKD